MPARIRYYVATSLDGAIADADGGVGWLDAFHDGDGVDYGYEAFFAGIACLVMGRATWDFIVDHGTWPYGDLPAFVFSRRELGALDGADFDRIERVEGSPALIVDRLRATPGGDVWLVGGGDLAAQFAAVGALDSVEVFTMPIVVGPGPRVFGSTAAGLSMTLEEHETFANGARYARYSPSP